ncbi:AAA family ATPase [Sunxiuqinia elliptica]
MSKNNQSVKWQDARLDLNGEYSKPAIILKVDDSIIFTLGNFSASAGKEKSKKSFNVTAITASLLSGNQVLNYSPLIADSRKKVLYIDTEQSVYHCLKIARRIKELTNLEQSDFTERLIFLALRKYSPEHRIEIIEQAIYENPEIFLVIIDGLRDLVNDINSPGESTFIMGKLLKWTDDNNIHIHNVLHLNKGDDNTRGHLGTELSNKSETILQVTKSQIEKSISIISSKSIRDIDFEDFAFEIGVDGLPRLTEIHGISSNKSFDYNDLSEQEHRNALEKIFTKSPSIGYGNLIKELRKAYSENTGIEFGIGKAKSLKKFLENKQMIVQEGKKYMYNSCFHY